MTKLYFSEGDLNTNKSIKKLMIKAKKNLRNIHLLLNLDNLDETSEITP
jgi:plasmid rolling circle replication initiator protein Rep